MVLSLSSRKQIKTVPNFINKFHVQPMEVENYNMIENNNHLLNTTDKTDQISLSPSKGQGEIFHTTHQEIPKEQALTFSPPAKPLVKVMPGVDIVEISRINDLVKKRGDKFLHRVFTGEELCYCLGKSGTPSHLAGRFAAKEAVIKLLKGKKSPDLKSVEIIRGKNGEPIVRLRNEAVEMAKDRNIHYISISISHSRDFAVAFAIGHYSELS